MRGEGAMKITRIDRRLDELLVMPLQVTVQKRIGLGNRRDTLNPLRLYQLILRRRISTFDPTIGLPQIYADIRNS